MTEEQFEDRERVETVRLTHQTGSNVEGDIYELVGGKEIFRKLCAKFYEGVAQDPILKPMYPEEDLAPAQERLQLFLEQYWGGPTTYQEVRGHPRLRLRHQPFKINPAARKAWLTHMEAALVTQELTQHYHAQRWANLDRAATARLNTMED